MGIYYIYKTTNILDLKSYIGYTNNLEHRKKQHIYASFNKNSGEYYYDFHKAIRYCGIDFFRWDVIFEHTDKNLMLDKMENYYIQFFNTLKPFGYNMTFGGQGNPPSQKGLKRKNETLKMISDSKKGTEFNAKYWEIISPNNDLFIIKNLKKFANDNELDYKSLHWTSKGRSPMTREGWKCKQIYGFTP